ncbi:hypothetical protein [Qipengyuania psychrotolerans]|uniref:Lipocalin-like domain-containing protein n=1 Tax=Qipengyuania psychrotolerans TaxID=2867238 RepID=A0ABX8ZB73_9SPHN|nr:hypothetical protein [Qipengyuania psychrotolerans]QZD86240.1 hypothetical protein K3166_08150 [Qipengyuania psychrotolerans]
MRKMMTAFAAVTLTVGLGACSETPETEAAAETGSIAGEWKANVDSANFENDNRNWVLADGEYQCNSCTPPYGFTANGEWQTVERPGVDSQKLEIIDDNTVKFASRLGDKELGSSTLTISEDGQSATIDYTDLSGDTPVNGQTMFTRTAAGPEGSHAMSGEWTVSDIGNIDDAGLMFSFALDGDTITSSGNGSGYTAALGGEPVAVEGSNSNTMVAVEKTGANSYRETYSRDGETLSTTEMVVEGDTISATSTDARDGSKVTWTASRQ